MPNATPDPKIARELAGCRKAWNSPKGRKAKFAWCCHHEVEIEPLTETAENRIAYILQMKPKQEQAVRLRNFRPVISKLPKAYDEAWKAYDEARKAYDEAGKACDEAWKAYYEARKAYYEARKAYDFSVIHKKDVPSHTWNGRSIFT